jgi:hypothetical protein
MAIIVPTLDPARTALGSAPDTRLGVRTSPEDFGAGLARGITDIAGDANRIYADVRKNINEARVLDIDTQDAAEDDAARRDLSQVRGMDAATAFDTIYANRKKRQAELMASLSNLDQRAAFRARAAARANAFEDAGNRHIIAEAQRYDQDTMDASAELVTQRIQGAGTNVKVIDANLSTFDTNHGKFAKRYSIPPEKVAVRRQAIIDRGLLGNISAQVDADNDLGAAQVFEHYKDAMSPGARADASKLLDAATTQGTAQRIVDQYVIRGGADLAQVQRILLGEFPLMDHIPSEARDVQDEIARLQGSTDPADISRREVLANYLNDTEKGPARAPEWVVAAMKNQKIRDAVENRAKDAIGIRERAREQQQDKLFTYAYKLAKDSDAGLDAVPRSMLEALEPTRRQQLEGWAHRNARGEQLPWRDSRKARYEIEAALRDPQKRDDILAQGPAAYLSMMNKDDQDHIEELFKKAGENPAAATADLKTKDDIIKIALAQMGLPLEAVTTEKGVSTFNERTDKFVDAVETRVRSALKPGEKPNSETWRKAVEEEKAAWVKKVLGPSKWYNPGTWGSGESMRAMEAPAFPRTAARVDQIPPDKLAKIAAAAAEKQTTLSDQQIVDIYNQQIMKEPARAE